MQVLVHPDGEALARAAASTIAERAAGGPITVGLAGGSTPGPTYAALGETDIDWEAVTLWLSDERWVPHDAPESNGRKALERLPASAAGRLIRPRFTAYLDPADSAVHYEAQLRAIHPDGRPDVVILGMGSDGHTASLFPSSEALHAPDNRWYVANHVASLDVWRLTVTPALLRAADLVLVLVTGGDKAGVLADAINGPDGRYPIQLLRNSEGDVRFLVDEAAAAALPT